MCDSTNTIKEKWNSRARFNGLDILFDHTGYITIGYYKTWDESLGQCAINMTERLTEVSNINERSHVLDLGCGRGAPILDTAVKTGCSVVGLDLSEEQIKLCLKRYEDYKANKMSSINAAFYCGSFYDFPEEIRKQQFTHVLMQTSLFYGHHRIDEILSQVSAVLKHGGIFAATDFYRKVPEEKLAEFKKWNSMTKILSLEETKAALLKHNLKYVDGEDLDKHCVTCNANKLKKVEELDLKGPDPNFFRMREASVKNGLVTFQLVVAEKI